MCCRRLACCGVVLGVGWLRFGCLGVWWVVARWKGSVCQRAMRRRIVRAVCVGLIVEARNFYVGVGVSIPEQIESIVVDVIGVVVQKSLVCWVFVWGLVQCMLRSVVVGVV